MGPRITRRAQVSLVGLFRTNVVDGDRKLVDLGKSDTRLRGTTTFHLDTPNSKTRPQTGDSLYN